MHNQDTTSHKSDFFAVLLSFLAGIVQLFLFFIGILGQVTGLQKIFINYDLYPFAILLSLVVSLCVVGVISFIKKNPDYFITSSNFRPIIWLRNILFDQTRTTNAYFESKKSERKKLIFALVILIIFAFLFIVSTVSHQQSFDFYFINKDSRSLIQLISFMGLWILTPVVLYVWISNEIEKNDQYKPENFILNLIRSLQSQGFIQITIFKDIPYQGTSHLVAANIQGSNKFFLVQYDGKRIISELTELQYNNLLDNQNQPQR